MPSSPDDMSRPSARKVERRTILKAAAWTVPTIVVATASPAAATASGTMVATSASGTAGGLANLTVTFTVNFAGTSPGSHTVTFGAVSIPGGATVNINSTRSIPVGGGSVQFSVTFVGDPRGKTATISYSIPFHGSGTIPAPIAGGLRLRAHLGRRVRSRRRTSRPPRRRRRNPTPVRWKTPPPRLRLPTRSVGAVWRLAVTP